MTTAQVSSEELKLVSYLTIKNVPEIARELSAAISRSGCVSLSVPADCEADVSFLQLLVSARKSAEASGKTLKLTQPPAGALRDALSRGGFLETGLNGLWNEEEGAA